MQRNSYFSALPPKYIFSEIQEREIKFRNENPTIRLISLSIGDTSQPLADPIVAALVATAKAMGTTEGYKGYGPERGYKETSEAIAKAFYNNRISADDIFISDGAGCDIGRLQILFGEQVTIACQDPSYPAYYDTGALLRGRESIVLLPCTPENNFFPDLEKALSADVLFFCSPSNPTGYAFKKEELQKIVSFARKHNKILIMDAAYSAFTEKCRSIYQIEGAEEVAIELGSFSKMAGFSGVRLGWAVVPKSLPHNMKNDWSRTVSTFFNGPSWLSQKAAIAACTHKELIQEQVDYYMQNTSLMRAALNNESVEIYGGTDAPYLWVRIKGKSSWEAFDELLSLCGITTMPGIGFGPSGEGFLRISCLGKRENIQEAAQRLKQHFASDRDYARL